ncbi:meiotically up-regulated gene 113-domain-containing protein [Neohortaea acidophila]|uniref:Meiotically up-regulated gene 113-domain-containing protein n=1 Tax=Neohortaea acidophila TaxID=245834 RepID=A0A6A6PWR8_9PEZI|nr:meiotically up-regulated gene 113-domain-containing protein [Neohortaea acidophila]KAF2484628.1 meiotically up-regulated gene 113-domain-containing protein [Neohortaea acidophila]
MPHFPHTPEALLGRNDSKNPASTCKGITSSGRACRRALASPKRGISSPEGDGMDVTCYCWQHKDQAVERVAQEHTASRIAGRRKSVGTPALHTVREKSSIDTLVLKLGIDASNNSESRNGVQGTRAPPAPLQAPYAEKYASRPAPVRRKKPGFWASLCCVARDADEDYVEIVRHRRRVEQNERVPEMSSVSRPPTHGRPVPRHNLPANPRTNDLLSLLPPGLSPQTTSALLAELVKPISPYDEDGYIYIFWLTPQSQAAPSDALAQSLLQSQSSRPRNVRKLSEAMSEFSITGNEQHAVRQDGRAGRKSIMLKIGRANNITRRMNEWQRQCGYALNLVRWYPYVSSSSISPGPPSPDRTPLYPDLTRVSGQTDSTGSGVRRCPHIHRVERLIQLELAAKQVKRRCGVCGKEHREWFEVEATEAGVKGVDEAVRRWVGWAEGLGGSGSGGGYY